MGSASSTVSANPLASSLPDTSSRPSDDSHLSTSSGPSGFRPSSVTHSSANPRVSVPIARTGVSHASFSGSVPTMPRHQSISTSLGAQLAKVELGNGEKEEGEISEGEEQGEVVDRYGNRAYRPVGRYDVQPQGPRRNLSPRKSRLGSNVPIVRNTARGEDHNYIQASSGHVHRYVPPSAPASSPSYRSHLSQASASASTSAIPLPHAEPARTATRESSVTFDSAPSDISPNEARKYMDIIRNLLQEGFSPDILVKKGATAKYVTAVCEEIVEGTKRRKELWLAPKPVTETSPVMISQHHTTTAVSMMALSQSPSSDVEVSVSTNRRMSLSSEGSAEFQLIENPSPPPPRRIRHPKLIPSSSWTPTPPAQPVTAIAAPAHAVKIETYKPAQSVSSVTSALPPRALQASIPPPTPPVSAGPPVPIPSLPNPPVVNAPSGPSRYNQPPPTGPKSMPSRKKGKKKNYDEMIIDDGPITLNYDEIDETPPNTAVPGTSIASAISVDASPAQSVHRLPYVPTRAPVSDRYRPPPPLVQSAPRTLQPTVSKAQIEIDKKNAMLEIRRKALESMKQRKLAKTGSPEKMDVDLPNPSSGSATPVPTSAAIEKSIEQEVLDLEHEVMGLQEAEDARQDEALESSPPKSPAKSVNDEEMPMELDSPEPGEIVSTLTAALPVPIAPIPVASASSSSLPSFRRGIKRPNAEDMESRPLSAPSWVRRKPFGGPVQRPNRLMINLDEMSESDSDDDKSGANTPIVVANVLIQDKEEQIRLLKEKIAARLKEKQAKKLKTDSRSNAPSPSPVPAVGSEEAAEIVAAQMATKVPAEPTEMKVLRLESDRAIEPEQEDEDIDRDVEVHYDTDLLPSATLPDPTPQPVTPVHFKRYKPLIGRYPQLSASTHSSPSYAQFSFASVPPKIERSEVFNSLDRQLLSSIVLTNRLARDPSVLICIAEAGGGICADPTCDALHLDKGDPTGEDWTEYLFQALSSTADGKPNRKLVQKAVAKALGRTFVKGKGKQPHSGKVTPADGRKTLEQVLAVIGGALEEEEQIVKAAAAAAAIAAK